MMRKQKEKRTQKEVKNRDVKTVKEKKRRKGHLLEIASTQSISPILDIKDGVIVTKDRHYFRLLEVDPINFTLRSAQEQDAIVSQFASMIRTWPSQVHLKIVSSKAKVDRFVAELQAQRAKEEASGNHDILPMIDDSIEHLLRLNDSVTVKKRFFIIIGYRADSILRRSPDFREIRSSLQQEVARITSGLKACGNSVAENTDRDYILEAIYEMLCKEQSMVIPFSERKKEIIRRYRERLGEAIRAEEIPVSDFFMPDTIDSSIAPGYLRIDNGFVCYAYVPSNAYPEKAYAGWLTDLFGYMEGLDTDCWIERIPQELIAGKLRRSLASGLAKEMETSSIDLDYEQVQSTVSSGFYIKQALAAGDEFCYFATLLSIYADTVEELSSKFAMLKSHISRSGLTLHRCTFQQKEAFLSSFPTAFYDMRIFRKSRRNAMASQLASIYPFTAYEISDAGGVLYGTNALTHSPVFINRSSRKYFSGNTVILGPSGSGKTYELLSLLTRIRLTGEAVYIVAPLKAHEFERICRALGGQFITIAPGSEQNINVMEIRERQRGDSASFTSALDRNSILAEKIQSLMSFFSLLVKDMTEIEKQVLDEALKSVYSDFGISENNEKLIDPATGRFKKMPTLKALYNKLRIMEDGERLTRALARFVTGTARSFSGETNVNLDNKFVVIDVSSMTADFLPIGMFIALDLIMDKMKSDLTTHATCAIDEMWRLMKASRPSAEFVQQIFKEIRGYGGSAIGATQDLSDVLSDEIGAAVINNSTFKIFLPMQKREVDAVASVVDLTEEEMSQMMQISSLERSRTRKALLIAQSSHLFINVVASPNQHRLFTTNTEDLKAISLERKEHGV